MVGIILMGCLCITIGMFVPVVFGVGNWFAQIACIIGLCVWSIGWFSWGMITTIKNFNALKIRHIDDDKKAFTIKVMLGKACVYTVDIPMEEIEGVE